MVRRSQDTVVRAALYARVSTVEQAEEGQSIEAQRRALRDYAGRNGMVLVEEFLDEGASATTDRRPAFQQMIAAARSKPCPFDVILVHKTDRFARNREHAIVYKNLLRRDCGVDVVSVTEPFDDTPQGRLMEGILEVMAEFYSANLGQEVRKGMTEKARRGEVLGLAPVGYRNGNAGVLTPVPGAADAVRWIFETYASGSMGYAAIANVLRADGTTRFAGLPPLRWSAQAVRNILRNEAYIGRRIWNMRGAKGRPRHPSEWIIVSNAHEPIVPDELFQRARERMQARIGPRGKLGDYLLRGVVRCEECGGSMYLRRMTRRGRPAGESDLILSCSRYQRSDGSCYFNWVRMDDLTGTLLETLRQTLEGHMDPSRYDFLFTDDTRNERSKVERALQQLNERYRRQITAYEAGVLDLDDLREARERISAERNALEERLRLIADEERKANIPLDLIRQRVLAAVAAVESDGVDPLPARRAALSEAVARVTYSRRQRRMRVTLRI